MKGSFLPRAGLTLKQKESAFSSVCDPHWRECLEHPAILGI